jgi:hypothetical protein
VSGNITEMILPTIRHFSNLYVIFLAIGNFEGRKLKAEREFSFLKNALGDSTKLLTFGSLADLPVENILISIILFYYQHINYSSLFYIFYVKQSWASIICCIVQLSKLVLAGQHFNFFKLLRFLTLFLNQVSNLY